MYTRTQRRTHTEILRHRHTHRHTHTHLQKHQLLSPALETKELQSCLCGRRVTTGDLKESHSRAPAWASCEGPNSKLLFIKQSHSHSSELFSDWEGGTGLKAGGQGLGAKAV